MVFGLKESTKVADFEKSNMSLVDSLFQAVKRVSKPSSLKYFRLGKWSQNKVRPIKMIFKDLEEKKVFFSFLYKLKTADEELNRVPVGHDLSPQERDHLNMLLKKAKEKN